MRIMTNQNRNTVWFMHARKGAMTLCFLLILMGLLTPSAFASSHSQQTATKATDLGPQLRLRRFTELGTFDLGGLAMVSENVGWTFTNKVQRTTDGGATWQTVAQNDPQGQWFIARLEILDEQIAWFVADDSQTFLDVALYRTNDGGQTWARFPSINPSQQIVGISAFDGQFAWITTQDMTGGQRVTHLYLVGGDHQDWQAAKSSVNGIGAVYFNSTKVGWATGISQTDSGLVEPLFETRDGTHHWKRVDLPLPTGLPTTTVLTGAGIIGFANESIGYLQASFEDSATQNILSDKIYRTLDGGKSWDPYADIAPENTIPVRMDASRLVPRFFPSVAFNGGEDLATLSLGTWSIHHIVPPDSAIMLSFITDDVMFTSGFTPDGTEQILFKSLDGGATWQTVATLPTF